MKTYEANRSVSGRIVFVKCHGMDVKYQLDPRPSQKIINHSPDGFEWGYRGSGPAQLALAILLDLYPNTPDVAESHYQEFKAVFIAQADNCGFVITEEQVRGWVDEQMQIDLDLEDRLRAKTYP